MARHIRKILNHQRDILAPTAVAEVDSAVNSVGFALAEKQDSVGLKRETDQLEKVAAKWLRPYPNAAWRENFEVLLVALAVAMAVRTFFLQPFKIPTGSMQPTLFGVVSEELPENFNVPSGLNRLLEWFRGNSYLHVVSPVDGQFLGADEPVGIPIFKFYQKLHFTGKSITVWFPPDYGSESLAPGRNGLVANKDARASVRFGQSFRKGETVIKLRVSAGDHLFVDRLTYNFRPPARGEIIVFETDGIPPLEAIQGDTFYIKRLVGLPGEQLALEPDYQLVNAVIRGQTLPPIPIGHLVVNGTHLSAETPGFENLYSFPGAPRNAQSIHYRKDSYLGHAALSNLEVGRSFTIGTNELYVLGDNTINSMDSRMWGSFPREKVIGKSFFVYWPLTKRFGWGSNH